MVYKKHEPVGGFWAHWGGEETTLTDCLLPRLQKSYAMAKAIRSTCWAFRRAVKNSSEVPNICVDEPAVAHDRETILMPSLDSKDKKTTGNQLSAKVIHIVTPCMTQRVVSPDDASGWEQHVFRIPSERIDHEESVVRVWLVDQSDKVVPGGLLYPTKLDVIPQTTLEFKMQSFGKHFELPSMRFKLKTLSSDYNRTKQEKIVTPLAEGEQELLQMFRFRFELSLKIRDVTELELFTCSSASFTSVARNVSKYARNTKHARDRLYSVVRKKRRDIRRGIRRP